MNVAIIGSGISGLGAAHVLSRAHEVEVFERADKPGGHANTIAHDGLQLDTGFIVFNERNYPRLVRLLSELGVRSQPSEMSFSVGCDRCSLEWSGRRPFAQPLNAASPRFLSFLAEVSRWLRTARRALEDGSHVDGTLLDFITERGYSRRFREHFLVPLTSALWSTAPERALDFPAGYAIRFFHQHGMLGFGRFGWRTVAGGSRAYVAALCEQLRGRIHLGLGVRELRRSPDGVILRTEDGEERRFDKVVVATHADQALRLLGDPSDDERRVLGAFGYTTNDAVLHSDPSLLPRRRSARASWNFARTDCDVSSGRPTITYYLNRLQRLEADQEYCVTLNRSEEIAPESVIARLTYEHPVYTLESLAAQRELGELSGPRHTVYAGAHHGYGFHEDGLASGVRAAALLGVDW
ncbi:MAG: FAD-dependent oxidoreductase [Actinobacteria bacterium]|nr:FAD-dependent oxidoreductase [Actinomycetota bacterium]